MQVFTLHPVIHTRASAKCTQKSLPPQVQRRLKLVKDWETMKGCRVPEHEIANVTGISRSTYYRYKKIIKLYGPEHLKPRSTRPKQVRKSQISVELQNLILKLRLENPTFGKAKLAVLLKRDFGVMLSESTLGRLLQKFIKQGEIMRAVVAGGEPKKRVFKGHAQRWVYGTKAKNPGELIQIDHMSVTKNGKYLKHFQAWDPITKIILADITTHATSAAAAGFLEKVQKYLPFPIRSIQVDGGSEFMGDFERTCADKKIPLFVLPPRRPQWNGGVERGNRTFRQEFYARNDVLGNTLDELKKELRSAVHKYNTFRPHQALKGLTPWQYTQSILETTLSNLESHML